jgi:uncharacterized membrane protein
MRRRAETGFAAAAAVPYFSPMAAATESPVFLDAVLAPHRSLPLHGFNILMLIAGLVSFVYGMVFVILGAWPVFGFLGLDALLIWLAFRASYRSARQTERIRLLEDRLTVERVDVRGARRNWLFQPYWLRVDFEEEDEATNRLSIRSHGRSLALATFLGPAQRRDFAHRLQSALGDWRAHFVRY